MKSELGPTVASTTAAATWGAWCQRWLRRALGSGCVLHLAVGIGLHATVQDDVFGPSLLWYASPPAVLAAEGLLLHWLWFRQPGHQWSRWSRLANISLLTWAVAAHWVWRPTLIPAAPQTVLRVVFWNTCYFALGHEPMAQILEDYTADVIVLAEVGHLAGGYQFLKERFPDYTVCTTEYGVALLVRGNTANRRHRWVDGYGYLECVDATVKGQQFELLVTDICGRIDYDRRPTLQRMANTVEEWVGDKPFLLCGDFNTPYASKLLQPLAELGQNAFRTRGKGYAPTWPVPVPVLELDQIWYGQGVEVLSCRAGWTCRSDHRPIVADFVVTD